MCTRLLWEPCAWRSAAAATSPQAVVPACRRLSTASPAEPLRILFCGSDDFSCTSLQALHDEMWQTQTADSARPGRIASLDVVVRPAKRIGRGFKTIKESPAKLLASSLGLRVHERDTFTGWQPPPVNMVIAVSFGLFVPPRILKAAHYGGLNVHPSFLPDLRGAAPIEHAILAGRTHTGVTVQTLDDCDFDAGRILLQGPPAPGLAISPRCTASELHSLLAPIGARLLVQTLRRGLYLPDAALPTPVQTGGARQLAPKLAKADQQVLWRVLTGLGSVSTSTSENIARRARALGPLWTYLQAPGASAEKRAILEDVELVACPDSLVSALRHGISASGPAMHAAKHSHQPVLTFVQHSAEYSARDSAQKTCTVMLPFALAAGSDTAHAESILLPVGVSVDGTGPPLCLRIGMIKIEGDRAKPAARAIGAFVRHDVPSGQIAWDVALQ